MNTLPAVLKKWFDSKTIKEKWFISLLAFSLLATGALFTLGDTTRVAENPLDATPFYFFSAFIKTIVVLLLIVGASIFLRRWVQPAMMNAAEKQMRVMETVRLSPKQALHLVMVGDQKLLIGATDQTITLIAPVAGDSAAPSDFNAVLRSLAPETSQP